MEKTIKKPSLRGLQGPGNPWISTPPPGTRDDGLLMQLKSCYWRKGEQVGTWPKNEAGHNQKPLSRRRLTLLGQKAVEMLYRVSPASPEQISWVVSCRHGDMHRMVALLSSLAKKEMLSPTDFSLSVHNAIVGAFSIETNNKKNHTALSGAALSFEAGLLEAFALQREKKETVGYIYYDMPLPEIYTEKGEEEGEEICLALLLGEKDKESVEFSSESIYLSYIKDEEDILNKNSSNISGLLGFLKNDAKEYRISVPSGAILLDRVGT